MWELENFLWILDLAMNLLSVAPITDRDLQEHFENKKDLITNNMDESITTEVRRNIYELLESTTHADVDRP